MDVVAEELDGRLAGVFVAAVSVDQDQLIGLETKGELSGNGGALGCFLVMLAAPGGFSFFSRFPAAP